MVWEPSADITILVVTRIFSLHIARKARVDVVITYSQKIVADGKLNRSTINGYTTRIKALFKWGVDAERERHAEAECHRRADQKPNPRKTSRKLGQHYTTSGYRIAIFRACKKRGYGRFTRTSESPPQSSPTAPLQD